jgi:hypothetical protein
MIRKGKSNKRKKKQKNEKKSASSTSEFGAKILFLKISLT